MKRIRYNSLALAVIAICSVIAVGAGVAHATPVINGAIMYPRVFNDCPVSTLNPGPVAYPALIHIDEHDLICAGGANLHVWDLSSDGGASSAIFNNKDAFTISATVTLHRAPSTVAEEVGLRVCPWWDHNANGFFNMRLPDGEIACFGGVLPFFSFTGTFGVLAQSDVPARQTIIYNPHCNTKDDPATIEYILDLPQGHFDSGPLPFTNCTAGEEAHGCYGIMDDARVGGRLQNDMFPPFAGDPAANNGVDYNDIVYTINQPSDCPVPTNNSTWGNIKAQYR
ncbi:MAG TPA: hypothetical protein VGR66_00340 [Candidatus Eisenbacteria bacterium]|jgi:hypothetical protein|nr:hypothetical protein [Candidatus Eisenbacteria bacterium]